MFAALGKALAQSFDPAFRGVFFRSLLVSVGLFVLVWVLAWLGLGWAGDWFAGWLAEQEVGGFWAGALDWLFGAAGLAGVVVASFLLFPAVTGLVLSLFLEEIADAVERRHYPGLPASRKQPLGEALGNALSFAATTILLNLVFLPLYLLLLFLPPFNLFVFYGLNGYLLGREYFELVAVRRLEPRPLRNMRKAYRWRLLLAGIFVAVMLTIPVVNLAMPIVATGFMVHVFEDLRRRGGAPGGA